jgi:hypothetical protein
VKTKRLGKANLVKKPHQLHNGPFDGATLYLDAHSDGATLWFRVRDSIGRYFNGQWEAMA